MKITLKVLFILLCILFISGCNKKIVDDNYYYVMFGEEKVSVKENTKVSKPTNPTKEKAVFVGWLDSETDELFKFDTLINRDYTLEPIFLDYHIVTLVVDGETIEVQAYDSISMSYIEHPTKEDYEFVGWYKDDVLYDFTEVVTEDFTLVAKFERTKIKVTYDFGYECYNSKDELRESYYKYFYDFLVSKNAKELKEENITDFEDFMKFMTTWVVHEGRSDLYHTGDAFKDYYVSQDIGGKLEDQPTTHFIGYCYQNGKYVDLIKHLITFFAYWRTDEGYSASDPNGNDFFAHSWSSLVDTAKFFYFTSDNLNEKYAWFNSKRVKDALDNIPGVGYKTLITESYETVYLPTDVTRYGYNFLGWYDNNGNQISKVKESMTVHAKWEELSKLELIANEFMQDFNQFNSLNLKPNQLDTQYLNSPTMVDFGQDETMYNKWKWLYQLIATLADDVTKDPESEGFSWNDNRGFYLANLCGFFTKEKHTDTWLKVESLDYANTDIQDQIDALLAER